MTRAAASNAWPPLAASDWAPTLQTLHLWTQIVGKVRMALMPPMNHWWHVTLYISARGLTTSAIPIDGRSLELTFDFLRQELRIACSDGALESVALRPMSVAQFYAKTMAALARLGVRPHIRTMPCEIEGAIPFDKDDVHTAYDGEAARRLWLALVQADRVMKQFRSRFIGKASPVHLFWGGFDLAVTRFSGRKAPPRGANAVLPASVNDEAYSHEVSSCGFWPGAPGGEAVFYAYAWPEPVGFAKAPVRPAAARWDAAWGEFMLPYEAVRTSDDPDAALLAFFQSTYDAAADLGAWPRAELERGAAA
jgi:hypothetical protein